MKIIKRSGSEDFFDGAKIVAAIKKANASVIDYEKMTDEQIEEIAENVETACENMKRSYKTGFFLFQSVPAMEMNGYPQHLRKYHPTDTEKTSISVPVRHSPAAVFLPVFDFHRQLSS